MQQREKKHHMCVRYLFSYNLLGIASTNYDDAQCPLHNIITSMLSVNHWSREDKFQIKPKNLCKNYRQAFSGEFMQSLLTSISKQASIMCRKNVKLLLLNFQNRNENEFLLVTQM